MASSDTQRRWVGSPVSSILGRADAIVPDRAGLHLRTRRNGRLGIGRALVKRITELPGKRDAEERRDRRRKRVHGSIFGGLDVGLAARSRAAGVLRHVSPPTRVRRPDHPAAVRERDAPMNEILPSKLAGESIPLSITLRSQGT
jgi:hypothetical protein